MHLDVAELPLVGGHPAVDLVNTLEREASPDGSPPHDYLADPAALLRWAVAAGLVGDAERDAVAAAWHRDPPAGQAALSATRDVPRALPLLPLLCTEQACIPTAPPRDFPSHRSPPPGLGHGRSASFWPSPPISGSRPPPWAYW